MVLLHEEGLQREDGGERENVKGSAGRREEIAARDPMTSHRISLLLDE
jgi:hypothetical protein